MSDLGKIAIGVVVATSTLALLIFGTQRFLDQQRLTDEIERLRQELYRARVGSDRCRSSLATSESGLRDLTGTIDSLRSRVDSFEALVGGGVPAERYEEYLDVFDAYNDSVASWEIRSERLQTAETACRDLIEEHNELRDSIQAVLEGAGLGEGG